MSSKGPPKLVQIHPHQTLREVANIVVVVPSIGPTVDSYRDEWSCNDGRGWVHSIPMKLSGPTVLQFFEHGLRSTTLCDWQELIHSGETLTQLLNDQYSSFNDEANVRVIFITHGYGGFIVKSALSVLKEDSIGQGLFQAVAGVVFISCPHLSFQNPVAWRKIPYFLLTRISEIPTEVVNPAKLGCLAAVCEAFDEYSRQLPALLIHESALTVLKGKPDNGLRKQRLADAELVRLPGCQPEIIAIPEDHSRILQLQNHPRAYSKTLDFIENAMTRPDQNISLSTDQRHDIASRRERSDDLELVDFQTRLDLQRQSERPERRRTPTYGRSRYDRHPYSRESATMDTGSRGESSSSVPKYRKSSFQSEDFKAQRNLALPLYINDPNARVNDFRGREKVLEKIQQTLCKVGEELESNRQGPRIMALHGIGGIGKTSIAWAFVKKCEEEELFDLVVWTSADDRSKILEALASAASMMNLVTTQEGQDQEFCARQLCDWFQEPAKVLNAWSVSNTAKATWLLVLDNVEDFEMVKEFVSVSGYGAILLTTRDHIEASEPELLGIERTETSEDNNLEIAPFSIEKSVDFMRGLSSHKDRHDDSLLKVMAKEIGGIPLVLRQAANIMRRRKMSPARFWQMYQDQTSHNSVFGDRLGSQSASYKHNISTVWGWSFLEQGAGLMRVVSLLDPDEIAESIFHTVEDVKDKSTLQDFPKNLDQYSRAKEELFRSSLVIDYEEKEAIRVHRVVQATVRSQMEPRILRSTFNIATLLLLQFWPKSGEEGGKVWNNNPRDTWSECLLARPHITALIRHYESIQPSERRDDVSTLSFARLLISAGWYDHDRGLSLQAQELFELSRQVCGRIPDIDDEIQAELHASQGAIATETNKADECFHHYQKFFDLTMKRFGNRRNTEDRINMALAHNELGIAKMMKNLVDGENGAMSNFNEARALLSEDIESNDDRALRAWGLASVNLAFAYWEREECGMGIQIVRDLLDLLQGYSDFEKKDSLVYGRAYHVLGNLFETNGNSGDALDNHRKAYERHSKALGKDHHRTADVAVRLALHHCRMNEFLQSNLLLDVAEKVFTTKACYKPEKARCLHYRSELLRKEGKLEDAREAERRAIALYRTVTKGLHGILPGTPPQTEQFNKLVTFWSR